jgi:hypothetical protein
MLPVLLALLTAPVAARSQDQPAPSPEDMVETAKQSYGPPRPKPRCDPDSADPDVIVVCGELEEQSQFRVRGDEEAENDYARETMNKGAPQAPNVDGPGIFQGPATFSLPPPPPPLIIDLDEIPDAPEGSDADLIGKGAKGN